jgi:protein-tyrosine-phosphatase
MIWNPFKANKESTLVFVCSANITRSPFFEGYLKKVIRENPDPSLHDLNIISAGLNARDGGLVHPVIGHVAQLNGFYLGKHRAQRFNNKIARTADLVLTMETSHKEAILKRYPKLEGKVFTVKEFGNSNVREIPQDIPDPTGQEVDDFREFVEDAISETGRILNILEIQGLP